MKLIINGKESEVSGGLTIAGLLEEKGLNPEIVIIEHNLELVKSESWPDIVLKENDRLEILSFVGGG
ncbi:MAG: sulfur carrier protein ThiS [Bacillota bacterium]|jgi:sulfur carrier protein